MEAYRVGAARRMSTGGTSWKLILLIVQLRVGCTQLTRDALLRDPALHVSTAFSRTIGGCFGFAFFIGRTGPYRAGARPSTMYTRPLGIPSLVSPTRRYPDMAIITPARGGNPSRDPISLSSRRREPKNPGIHPVSSRLSRLKARRRIRLPFRR
jgi:hypothetical protein